MKKFKESLIMIIQSVAIIIAFVFPFLIDVQKVFEQYLAENYPTPDNFWIYLPLSHGNVILSVAISVFVYWQIRKSNGDRFMNRDNNIYHDYPYIWYLYCVKFLGIKKCNLINVPIYMQIKLVIHQTFDEYPLNDNEYPEDGNEVVFTCKENEGNKELNCNLILEDTYPINAKQIPEENRKLYTVKVSRNNKGNFGRHYSEKFVSEIIDEVRKLPNGITLNVYATTNPKNTLNIARRVFAQAERGNVSHLYVYKQSKTGERPFENKGKKIY